MSAIRTIFVKKETYTQGVTVDSKPGLQINSTPGMYFSINDLDTVKNWSTGIIYNLKTRFDSNYPSASIITGWIEVPKSGIYYFSTNVEQCWIHGNLLINNNGEVKNHSRNDASVALSKGKHPLKIIFLNNIVGGRPSAINGIRLFYRCKTDSKSRLADATMLSH
jgi:hexosaminidase